MAPPRKTKPGTEEEKEMIAYHETPLTLGRIRCAIWFQACEKVSGKGQARRGDRVRIRESCSIAGRDMQGKICLVRERVENWLHLDAEISTNSEAP